MIRVVTQDDFPLAKEMLDELSKESIYSFIFKNHQMTRKNFDFYLSDPKERFAIFVLDENKEIGIAVFDIAPWYNNDIPIKIARLAYLYVRPEYRGKGYGKEIKEAFEYWGKSVGANYYSTSKKAEDYLKVETIYMKEVK